MYNTYFENASGLPAGKKDRQYTTAEDLVLMMKYAAGHKIILELMSQKEADIYGSDMRKIHLATHNKTLLWREDAPWGKTGYTKEARRTFTGIDPSFRPRIVFALLQSNDLWDDINELKDQGLEAHRQRHRTFLSDLIEWVKSTRERGHLATRP